MFGRNIVVKPVWDVDNPRAAALLGQELLVNSIWPTIQGEGPNAGCPAIFVRLTGCNLRCTFCDTEFEAGRPMTLDEIVKRIKLSMDHCETDLIVLTGGEPMRQQIIPFLARCADIGWYVQIETAGTVWPPDAKVKTDPPPSNPDSILAEKSVSLDSLIIGDMVQLVCSPKTPKVHPKIEEHCDHFKYIIRKGETDDERGLPNHSTQIEMREAKIYAPHVENVLPTIWVQPCQEYSKVGVSEVPDAQRTQENVDEAIRVAMRHGYRISLQTHRILGVD
jgi:7-carboxy-7-deazaguanine synthase